MKKRILLVENVAKRSKDAQLWHERNCKGEQQQQQPSTSVSGVTRKSMPASTQTSFKITKTQTAFANATTTWKLAFNENNGADYTELLARSIAAMKGHITKFRQKRHALKFNMSLYINFEKATDASIVTDPPVVLVSEQMEVYEGTDVDDTLKITAEQLINLIETYEMNGSGWIVSRLMALDTTVWLLDALRGREYVSSATRMDKK